MENNKVSVVIATYNGSEYVENLLESIENQTKTPFEIIISDDCSKDNTRDIIKYFIKHSKTPVKFFENDQSLGYADNFMLAASKAEGDVIAFCDQDDVWAPEKLEVCAEKFLDPDVMLVVHKATLVDKDLKTIGVFDQSIAEDVLKGPLYYNPWFVFAGFSMVFRRKILTFTEDCVRGVDFVGGSLRLPHDRWIMYLANMFGKTAEVDKELVLYRQHGQNIFGGGVAKTIDTTLMSKSNLNRNNIIRKAELHRQFSYESYQNIEKMGSQVSKAFPLFDKEKCKIYWRKATLHYDNRIKIYKASNRITSFALFSKAVISMNYTHNEKKGVRWRAMLKDMLFILHK